jgi:diguanylate cyclase (GGDEF)-like protein
VRSTSAASGAGASASKPAATTVLAAAAATLAAKLGALLQPLSSLRLPSTGETAGDFVKSGGLAAGSMVVPVLLALLYVLLQLRALRRARAAELAPPSLTAPRNPFEDPSGVEPPNLTGLSRRLAAAWMVERAIQSATRKRQPLVLATIQVERPDGRDGDREHERSLTSPVAMALAQTLGPDDSVVRYGGDEFICLLPRRRVEDAASLLERTRREVEAIPGHQTVSFGLAPLRRGDSAEELMTRASQSAHHFGQRRWDGSRRRPTLRRSHAWWRGTPRAAG